MRRSVVALVSSMQQGMQRHAHQAKRSGSPMAGAMCELPTCQSVARWLWVTRCVSVRMAATPALPCHHEPRRVCAFSRGHHGTGAPCPLALLGALRVLGDAPPHAVGPDTAGLR
jgi:hypothetical protein